MQEVTTRGLLAEGWTRSRIATAVQRGLLLRARQGHYLTAAVEDDRIRAIRVGGELGCVSELRRLGIWVIDDGRLHVRVEVNASRLRDPDRQDRRLEAGAVRLHWRPSLDGASASGSVSVVEALAEARRCLDRRAWIASIDSALHQGLIEQFQLGLLAASSAQASKAVASVDRRAESGLESIVRVTARDMGFRVRSQVRFAGVGRVDLLVEDWIVVETDGSAFHGVAVSARDRWRDARLAAKGLTVLRPGYSLVVHDLAAVAEQLIGAVQNHRRVRSAGVLAARARMRARKLGLS